MSVLVTPDEMRAAEAAAIAAGLSEPDLMRRAAVQIAGWIDSYIQNESSTQHIARRFAIALVGPGNNGGDALVALALLIERGWRCAAIFADRREIGTLPVPAGLLDRIELVGPHAIDDADVILDGVYGIGGRMSLPPIAQAMFRRANEVRIDRGTPLISIDVPSGIDARTGSAAPGAFQADVTLCLGLPKIGLIKEPAATHVGELRLLDIGIVPPSRDGRPVLIDELSVRRSLPRRRASAHKHQTGTVLIIGGAPTYYGAPRLSAESAARAGAGLVCVAVPATIAPVVATQVPELVLLPLGESVELAAVQISEWVTRRGQHLDAVVVGPGLGQDAFASDLLYRLISGPRTRVFSPRAAGGKHPFVVLDADALNWIAKRGTRPSGIAPGSAVMTPHAGELGRLLGVPASEVLDDPIQHAVLASKRYEQVVILKSGYSIVATPDGEVRIAPRSMPELATAGTGDVLSGLVGGLLAQGLDPSGAASAAVYIGGRAGFAARQKRGLLGVLARDVIDGICLEMQRLVEPLWMLPE